MITCNDDNTAPTITPISNFTGIEDTPIGPVAFTVNDGQTAQGLLTLTASSSNTTLLPDSNIVFGGSGASRTVTLTPAPNQNGSSVINIIVTDDGAPDTGTGATFGFTFNGLASKITVAATDKDGGQATATANIAAARPLTNVHPGH